MDEPTADLVRRAQRGEQRAFAELVRRYERAALGIVYAITGDGAGAGDVVQEAFTCAWRSLGGLREPGRFGPWLAIIVRRLAADERRRLLRRGAAEESMEKHCGADVRGDGRPEPVAELSQRETGGRVAAALRALDEVTRTAMVLRYFDGHSSREIGALLGLSPAAVDMRLARARAKLRQRLAPLQTEGCKGAL